MLNVMRTNKGEVKIGLIILVLALLGLGLIVLLAVGGLAWFMYLRPEPAVVAVPVPPAASMPVIPMPDPVQPPVTPVPTPMPTGSDFELARAAMQQYGNAADRAQYPFRVDNVQVRGDRAIGNYTPVTSSGRVDEERPGGLFVAQKVKGNWQVYALGTDIVDPWAQPIARIYGNQ